MLKRIINRLCLYFLEIGILLSHLTNVYCFIKIYKFIYLSAIHAFITNYGF